MAGQERRRRAGKSRAGQRSGSRSRRSSEEGSRQGSLFNPRYLKALNSPLRIDALVIFAERKASAKEIAKELGIKLPTAAYHVKVLRDRGLVAKVGQARRRGAVETYYQAVHPTILPPDFWASLPLGFKSRVSAKILREFFETAAASIDSEVFEEKPGTLSLTPLLVDERGRRDIAELASAFEEGLLKVQADASERIRKSKNAKAVAATAFLAFFRSAKSSQRGMTAPERRSH